MMTEESQLGLQGSLDEASILAEAREKAGLTDFGDESFLEPMRLLLRALDGEAHLNVVGRMTQRQRVLDILINRLRAEDYFRRHPDILEERIEKPFVIVGLARTGTTNLHRLIANDPRIHSLKWWECRNPAPFPDTNWVDRDPRIAVAEEEVKMILEASPQLATIHPWDPEGPDEEIMLVEHSFLSTTPESMADIPTYGTWLARQDLTPGYEYLKKLLQFLQWQKKKVGGTGRRWVLKAPFHLGFMDVLFKVFPDVKVIQTHRDPLATIPSFASMIYELWRLASDEPDPLEAARQWGGKMATHLKRCMVVRDSLPADRFLDVQYKDVVRDPIEQVRRIYAFVGMELTPETDHEMRTWAKEHSRDKRPPHSYTMEKFGLSEEGIKRQFATYRERFILGREG
jgi:hypothetical protein